MATPPVHFLECEDILELETSWEQCGHTYESCSSNQQMETAPGRIPCRVEHGETCGAWRDMWDMEGAI